MNHEIIFREFYKSENKPEYINRCITAPTEISYTQKRSTKKAILWLLSKAPHTVEEISEHFEISPELVNCLIDELTSSNFVVKVSKELQEQDPKEARESQESQECGCFPRYQLNLKKKIIDKQNVGTTIIFPSLL